MRAYIEIIHYQVGSVVDANNSRDGPGPFPVMAMKSSIEYTEVVGTGNAL